MIGIFVLHYNEDEKTDTCLDALYLDAARFAKITVIDNGSTTPYRVLKMHEGVRVHRYPENLPLIQAYNQAMQSVKADVYISMANDTEAFVGMTERLLQALEDRTVGIVAPGTNDTSVGDQFVPAPGDWESVDVKHVDNTCWGWRRDLVERIGWPDAAGHPHRANWGSNQDFCYRARLEGYRILAVRGAYIRHAHTGGQDKAAYEAGQKWLKSKWGQHRLAEIV